MILLSVISLIISLLIQGLLSNFLGFTIENLSIFSANYVLINLIVLEQYYENDKKFLILLVIFGLLVDIVYSNTFIFCTCIYIFIFYINKLLRFYLPYNLLTVNLFSIISMIVYNIITFIFLTILKFDSYGIAILFKIIGCNLIMTILYTSILYWIISTISKKLDLKIVRER